MALTTAAGLVVPEVWADMVQAEFENRAVMRGVAAADDSLVGVPGQTINFPEWAPLDEATELDETTPITPQQLTSTDRPVTVKEAGKGVEITDRAQLYGAGDAQEEAQRQVGVTIARKVDTDLVTAASGAAFTAGNTTNPMSWHQIVAGLDVFGDRADNTDGVVGIVIHSKQKSSLWDDDKFLSADTFGEGTPLRAGQIGSIAGIPVMVSDRVPVDTTNGIYSAFIVLRGALGLIYKRRPDIETDRDIVLRSNLVTANVHYATALMEPEGVCVLDTAGFTP